MSMMEKASYLKGLADGLALDNNTKEGKLIAALVEMVELMAEKIAELDHDVEELNDYCEELDEDLGDVEEVLLDLDEDECDGDCGCCDCADECDYMDETFEIECPSCGDKICFDESVDPEELVCPACGEKISCKFEDEE